MPTSPSHPRVRGGSGHALSTSASVFFSYGRCHGPTCGRLSGPMHVHELLDLFLTLHHHVPEHVDDIVLVIDVVLVDRDILDGVLELVGVPDDLLDALVGIVLVLGLLVELPVVRDDDIPLSSFSNPLSCLFLTNPLSYLFLSNSVPLSDMLGRGGDDRCRGRTGRSILLYGR